MSAYNIKKLFSYNIATSSLEYIRNYNFNTATVSDIPITMYNSGSEIPITVNITTTEPWMQIVDPTTGISKKYPEGNVVLQPTSSVIVVLKVDLPPEIENRPESVIYPSINLEIKSGSMPIITPATVEAPKNIIVTSTDSINISTAEQIEVSVTIYDVNGNIDTTSQTTWSTINPGVAQVIEPVEVVDYRTRSIISVAPGTTELVIQTSELRKTIPITVRGIPFID